MTAIDDYLLRVHALLATVDTVLTAEEMSEIMHLVEHDEPAEALRTLAWIVVDEQKHIPASAISEIRELTRDLIAEQDMPGNLDSFAEEP
jgi:hypothetical protein